MSLDTAFHISVLSIHLPETASDTICIFKNLDITDFKPLTADARPKTKR